MNPGSITALVILVVGLGLLMAVFFKKANKWISTCGIILIGVAAIIFSLFSLNRGKHPNENYQYSTTLEDPEDDELVAGTVWSNPKYTRGLGWIL